MSMTSDRPYMIRALHEWILDNNCTPYIMVNAYANGVEVPQEFVKDGQIVLNISPQAIRTLAISNVAIEFEGRFGGIPNKVYVPVAAVLGIYARENGQGLMFDNNDPVPDPPRPDGSLPSSLQKRSAKAEKSNKKGGKPSLRVVK